MDLAKDFIVQVADTSDVLFKASKIDAQTSEDSSIGYVLSMARSNSRFQRLQSKVDAVESDVQLLIMGLLDKSKTFLESGMLKPEILDKLIADENNRLKEKNMKIAVHPEDYYDRFSYL